jgi:L-alanine-DL-glutamate epimerase-like enolase superfamily enzyme
MLEGEFRPRPKTLDDLTREVESYVERGFRAMKMKIGR